MGTVFISYAKEDSADAQKLAHALERAGFSVWWDRHIPPGKTWDEVIGHALDTAACAVVLWSESSVRSRWVREEAERAASRGCLVPIVIAKVSPPLGFGRLQAADLSRWRGNERDSEFVDLVSAISDLVPPVPARAAADQRPGDPAKHTPWRQKRRNQMVWTAAAVSALAVTAYFAQRRTEPPIRPGAATGLPAPQQIAPLPGTSLSRAPRPVIFAWHPVPGARSYSVEQVFLEPGEECPSTSRGSSKVSGIVGTTYTFVFTESRPGCWRISAVDDHGSEGSKSAWWKFPFWWTSGSQQTGGIHPGCQGFAEGCHDFADSEDTISRGPITRITVYHGDYITGIRIRYGKDGIGNPHGYTETRTEHYVKETEWKIPDRERITHVEGQIAGKAVRIRGRATEQTYLSRLQFFTDEGHSSPQFGRNPGTPFVVSGAGKGALRTISGSVNLRRGSSPRAITSMTFQFGVW